MTEEQAIKEAIERYIRTSYGEAVAGGASRDEWLAILKERVRALIFFIERDQLSCLDFAKKILEM